MCCGSIYLLILIAGFGGGLLRGLVGFVKYRYSYKNVSFNLPYFLAMMLTSGIIGLLTAIVIKELGLNILGLGELTPPLAFVVGYAGGDFLENVYKTILKKPSIYTIPIK